MCLYIYRFNSKGIQKQSFFSFSNFTYWQTSDNNNLQIFIVDDQKLSECVCNKSTNELQLKSNDYGVGKGIEKVLLLFIPLAFQISKTDFLLRNFA